MGKIVKHEEAIKHNYQARYNKASEMLKHMLYLTYFVVIINKEGD